MVDAPEVTVGAALLQFINADWHPLVFFSKMLKPTERKYSTFDRELRAVYLYHQALLSLPGGQTILCPD